MGKTRQKNDRFSSFSIQILQTSIEYIFEMLEVLLNVFKNEPKRLTLNVIYNC